MANLIWQPAPPRPGIGIAMNHDPTFGGGTDRWSARWYGTRPDADAPICAGEASLNRRRYVPSFCAFGRN